MRALLASLAAVLVASSAGTRRVKTEEGAASVEPPPAWRAKARVRGNALALTGPKKQDFLLVGDAEDGTAASSVADYKERLRGAAAAVTPRETASGQKFLYHRIRKDAGWRVQGTLRCEGRSYLFEARANRVETVFDILESFECKKAKAQAGVPIGGSGWSIAPPAGYTPHPKAAHWWERKWKRTLVKTPTADWWMEHTLTMKADEGSETWTPKMAWPLGCDRYSKEVASAPQQITKQGKPAFVYTCTLPRAIGRVPTQYLDLVYDYDPSMTTARFIRLRGEYSYGRQGNGGCPSRTDCRVPDGDPEPDPRAFQRFVSGLGRAAGEEAGAQAPPPPPAAVPLLR